MMLAGLLLATGSTSFVLRSGMSCIPRASTSCTLRLPAAPFLREEDPGTNQMNGVIVGSAFLGPFIVQVSLGVLSRLGLISLPPLNSLTDISNNAMEDAIAAGTLQPLLATAWATNFWLDLIRQYLSSEEQAAFVAAYCADHANLCVGIQL